MPQQMHFWITANHEGQTVLIYGGLTEKEATDKGYAELDCFFEVKQLPTRDVAAASRMLKGETLHNTQDLGASLKRLKHTT